MKPSAIITLVVLAVFSLAGATYMATGVLDLAVTKKVNKITVLMNTSGGLMSNSQATMRGIKIGQVSRIETTPTGLSVSVNLDSGVAVPADSRVSVQNLSAAGEQYIEFAPTSTSPPYLADGSTIAASQVAPSYTVSEILAKGNALMDALDATDVNIILKNLGEGLVDNAAALDKLALTTGLINQMVQDDKRYLTALVHNGSVMTAGLGEMQAGDKLRQTAKVLPDTLKRFVIMLDGLKKLAELGADEVVEGSSLPNLIDKIVEYADELSGPLKEFVTVLSPVTAPLRDLKVDAGHWLDFWDSTFSDTGGARVHLGVPEFGNEPAPQNSHARQTPVVTTTPASPAARTPERPTP